MVALPLLPNPVGSVISDHRPVHLPEVTNSAMNQALLSNSTDGQISSGFLMRALDPLAENLATLPTHQQTTDNHCVRLETNVPGSLNAGARAHRRSQSLVSFGHNDKVGEYESYPGASLCHSDVLHRQLSSSQLNCSAAYNTGRYQSENYSGRNKPPFLQGNRNKDVGSLSTQVHQRQEKPHNDTESALKMGPCWAAADNTYDLGVVGMAISQPEQSVPVAFFDFLGVGAA